MQKNKYPILNKLVFNLNENLDGLSSKNKALIMIARMMLSGNLDIPEAEKIWPLIGSPNARLKGVEWLKEDATIFGWFCTMIMTDHKNWLEWLLSKGAKNIASHQKGARTRTPFEFAASSKNMDKSLTCAFLMLDKQMIDWNENEDHVKLTPWLRPFHSLRKEALSMLPSLAKKMRASGANPFQVNVDGKGALYYLNWQASEMSRQGISAYDEHFKESCLVLLSFGLDEKYLLPLIDMKNLVTNTGIASALFIHEEQFLLTKEANSGSDDKRKRI